MMRNMALFVVLAGFSAAAFADDVATSTAPPRLSTECRAQIMSLCPKSGDPQARRACLAENRSKISEPCLAELKARRDAMKAMKAMKAINAATPPMPTPATQ